jgi:T-complex protein 1 subunit delta
MVAQSGLGDSRKAHTGAYKDKSKPADIRSSNINAAKGKFGVLH